MDKVAKIMVAAAAALTLASCGESSQPSAAPGSNAPSAAAPASTPKKLVGKECTADDIKTTGKFGEKPEITIPDSCDPPTKLITKDLSVGTGPAAKSGDSLEMNYLLVTWSDKKVLDTSFGSETFKLNLGAGDVIKGWDQGLVGTNEGSRRLLIIPPDLAYGAGGRGIQPNETLVFVTDAVKVGPGTGATP
ncbi:FKBP-type peptidyl-prolyl cis-trans isomerase [Amycolatopsis sp.]|jgi:peptidylprolyl isomerase|uniref:FKBP-type peptidyl-prolyl cis-trans isomerase n=1 Tax=Amycolatopsis sp. TaxID=37632 RepID=UPI002E0C3745|nr:FKBP-type peptidyl-prolyl cis-trans isomerase [Amycolatopsis sp.]